MKTPEEIKNSMRQCYGWLEGTGRCDQCKYNDFDLYACGRKLIGDALAHIEHLEAAIYNSLNERDQLLADLNVLINKHGSCDFCKHKNKSAVECKGCTRENDHWEWRGVQEVKDDDA